MEEESVTENPEPPSQAPDEPTEGTLIPLKDEPEEAERKVSDNTESVTDKKTDKDSLKDVPLEDFPDMLFRMKSNFPQAIHAHEHVCALVRWKKSRPDLQIAILAPEGDYKKGIIFFSLQEVSNKPGNKAFDNYINGYFNGSVYCHSNEEKIALQKALSDTERVPISQQYKMCRLTCMTVKSYHAVKSHLPSKRWCLSADVVLWLPWYCARDIDITQPRDVEIRELTPEDAEKIDESWPYKFPGSKELIADMIVAHYGLGVFRKDDLLSWAIRWMHGGIGLIQTVEAEKGKGYCRAAVEGLTKLLGKRLSDVHLFIPKGKKNELAYFTAIGFRYAFMGYSSESKKNEDNKESVKMESIDKKASIKS